MPVKIVEAQLLLSGRDAGASDAVNRYIRAVQQAEKENAQFSKGAQQVAKTLLEVEKQQKAVEAVLGAQRGTAAAEANLQKVRAAATATAGALDKARAARQAFDGQASATKAVAAAEREQRTLAREVAQATRAYEMQTRALREAERAAAAANIPLRSLEQHQATLARTYEQTSNALRQQIRLEDAAGRAATRHAREQAEAAKHIRQHGAIGYVATVGAGYVGAHGVVHGATDAVKAGARLQHEVVALRNAGRTPHEMDEIERASRDTVKAVPTATFEENLKVINETTGAFGSLHHAIENLTFMQKSSAVLHASAGDKIHDGAGELGNKLARFFEMRGTAGNTPLFQREASEMVRAMVFTRGNFNPGEMVNFAQQAKASLPLYNERFLTKIVPSLVTEFGGDRAGTAANAFRGVIMGKANDQKQAEEWVRLGLLDKSMARIKGGHVVSWKAGAVKDTDQALSDPLEWAETVLIPALKRKGVNTDDKLELSKALGTLFRNSNSNMFAEALTQNLSRTRLHKDEENIRKSGTTDEIYTRNLSQDPSQGVKALKAGIEDLLAATTSPMMQPAAAGLKTMAEGIQSLALAAKDHPMLAAGAGTAAAAGGLAASGYLSYKIATGFGLPAAAGELTVAAKMLQAAAVEKGAVPNAVKAIPLAGFGLGGITVAGAAAAAFAGYATAQELPKVAEREGPTAIDPATGEHIETEVPKTTPWLRNWLLGAAPEEAGKAVGAEIGKGIVSVPLPPPRPDAFRALSDSAGEAGKEAGEKAGDGVRAGIESKAPAVEQQGRNVLQRLQELFAAGIYVPIRLAPGEGFGGDGAGGMIQRAGFGGGLGGLIRKASFGGGGVGAGGGGGGPMPAIPASVKMSDAERNELGLITKYEAGGRNVPNYINDRTHTAQGYYQITNTNWRRIAPQLGIAAPNAMSASLEDQTRVALHLRRESGLGNWTRYNPRLRAAIGRGERVQSGVKDPAALDPRLVKGLDGKEGLDLGNGTMRMPTGETRPISGAPPMSSRTVPDAPPAGFGRSNDMQAAADRMHAAAERMEAMTVRTHHTVELTGDGRDRARVKKMRVYNDGPVRGNVGVSMPQTEIG